MNGDLVTELTTPDDVTEIKDYTFFKCTGLTSVVIPNSVTSIGYDAFYGCSGLKTVYNFSNLSFSKGSSNNGYVANYADKVYNAPNGSIEGDFIFGKPNDVNTLLYYLGNAAELTLPADYKGENYAIGDSVFYVCTSLTSIVIPNSVTSIAGYAFSGCTGLTSIEIPNSVTSIGYGAFEDCTGLTSIEIPNSVTSISGSAFEGCSGITNIEICDGVMSIGEHAFAGCSATETLYISNTIESIGDYAFSECHGLFEIKIGAKKVITANENIFSEDAYNNALLYVPSGREQFYARVSPWSRFIIAEMDFTGIDEVPDGVKGESGRVKTVYDLNGRVVENPSKGLYIINGKKVLVK